jgi:hypothetical protein
VRPELNDVTLVCASSDRINGSLHAMLSSIEQVKFARSIFFTHSISKIPGIKGIEAINAGIEFQVVDEMKSQEDYNSWVVKRLADYITTSHALIVQWDGYVLNGPAWEDEFLQFDWVGAPWPNGVVGNGGFNLRSRRIMEASQDPSFEGPFTPEDTIYCKKYRSKLELSGFVFAPPAIARRFSVENDMYMGQFGWHGRDPFFHGVKVHG